MCSCCLVGADPVPIPYNKASLTRVQLARPQTSSHNGAVIPSRAWPPPSLRAQHNCSGKGDCRPQRVSEGDRDLTAHLFRSIHLRGALQGAFCCWRRVHQDRRTKGGTGTPSPLSERRGVHLQGKPAPTAEPAAPHGFRWGEGCSPPASKRIMSRRTQSRYPLSPCHTHEPVTAHANPSL